MSDGIEAVARALAEWHADTDSDDVLRWEPYLIQAMTIISAYTAALSQPPSERFDPGTGSTGERE